MSAPLGPGRAKEQPFPKGPCTHIVYTLALKDSLCRYIGPKVYAVLVHRPLGILSPPTLHERTLIDPFKDPFKEPSKEPYLWVHGPLDLCNRSLRVVDSRLNPETGAKPEERRVETFRTRYLVRTLEVEKLSLQPIRKLFLSLSVTLSLSLSLFRPVL